jgi:RNA-directed DNA polymerase
LQAGRQALYDADLKSYFDTISHEKLLACLRQRVTDRTVLGLIRMWLEAVVVEPGEDGTGGKVTRNEKGTLDQWRRLRVCLSMDKVGMSLRSWSAA